MWTVEPPDLWIYNGDCLNPGNTCIKHLILACAAGDYAYQRNAVPFADSFTRADIASTALMVIQCWCHELEGGKKDNEMYREMSPWQPSSLSFLFICHVYLHVRQSHICSDAGSWVFLCNVAKVPAAWRKHKVWRCQILRNRWIYSLAGRSFSSVTTNETTNAYDSTFKAFLDAQQINTVKLGNILMWNLLIKTLHTNSEWHDFYRGRV